MFTIYITLYVIPFVVIRGLLKQQIPYGLMQSRTQLKMRATVSEWFGPSCAFVLIGFVSLLCCFSKVIV